MRLPQFVYASLSAAILITGAAPATAEVFYKPPAIPARLLAEPDPSFDPDLPGATDKEKQAQLVWSLRQGLLLGALQCHTQYPTLLTTSNYNALLTNHAKELAGTLTALNGYFKRVLKQPKAAQVAFDQFATRTTTVYSTVGGQKAFCHTVGSIGRRALFTPKGMLGQFAKEHLGQLRASLNGGQEQQFRIPLVHREVPIEALPPLDNRCWTKKNAFNTKKCGGEQQG
jgi:hypothetical protein